MVRTKRGRGCTDGRGIRAVTSRPTTMPISRSNAGAESLLLAATELFAAAGFDGASIASIAEKAGMSKANVFHHYSSKEALYVAVIERAATAGADYAEELHRVPGSSADKVRRLIEFEVRHMLENPQSSRLLLREIADGGHARKRKLARTVYRRNFAAMASIFEQGKQRGEFYKSLDPAAAAMLLSGAAQCFFSCRPALGEYRAAAGLETPAVYAERVAAIILSGVLRRDAADPPSNIVEAMSYFPNKASRA
jgi:TetR/AcrR family transcriptional regulator